MDMVVIGSVPQPPYSLGIGMPCTPKEAHFSNRQARTPVERTLDHVAVELSTSEFKRRICKVCCSGVRSKSMACGVRLTTSEPMRSAIISRGEETRHSSTQLVCTMRSQG